LKKLSFLFVLSILFISTLLIAPSVSAWGLLNAQDSIGILGGIL